MQNGAKLSKMQKCAKKKQKWFTNISLSTQTIEFDQAYMHMFAYYNAFIRINEIQCSLLLQLELFILAAK